MSSPAVSIVLPTYNRAELLRLSIESVLNQSFEDWELLVIDSFSKDNTSNMMKEFIEKDSRINYFNVEKSKDRGITKYLNYGISVAKGKYIARLDDDDVWCFKDKLKQQYEFLESNPDYVLVGGGVIMVDENDNELYRYCKKETDKELRKYAMLSCPFDHPTILFRKQAIDLAGGYGNYEFAEDWDLFLKLGKVGKFYNFQEYYIKYLQAWQGISVKNQTENALTELKILKLYKNDYPNYYLGIFLTTMQYLYTLLPDFLTKRFHYSIRYIKRKFF